MDLSAVIELQRPGGTLIVTAIPLFHTVDSVSAYDGVLDYGGTSGKTYANVSADKTESWTSPPPASDLVLFTGLKPELHMNLFISKERNEQVQIFICRYLKVEVALFICHSSMRCPRNSHSSRENR